MQDAHLVLNMYTLYYLYWVIQFVERIVFEILDWWFQFNQPTIRTCNTIINNVQQIG